LGIGSHGTAGLIAGYGLALCGLVAGLIVARAARARFIAAPLMAAPIAIAAALAWSVAAALVPVLGRALGPAGTAVVGALVVAVAGFLAGRFAPGRADPLKVKRGTTIVTDASAPRPRGSRSRTGAGVWFAGQPVPAADETKHFKLLGTTGTGKSTAIRGLLAGALARGDRAVIADPDGGYLAEFYDPARGDLLLNPFDPRSARWDLFGELANAYDSDQLARALIADQAGEDRTWRTYARVLVAATLRQLHRAGQADLATLHRLLMHAPVEELAALLGETAAAPYLSSDNARFFGSVRAIANTHLAVLEHLEQPARGLPLSIRQWVRGPPERPARGVLFLPYRASHVATLRGVISTWLRLAVFETMELGAGDHRLWFVVDELDALGAIDGLKDALARLRKFGGRCVVGFQSIAQVSGIYGAQDAQTIVENCGNTLILRCSASENGGTARFASKLIGEREVIREQVSRSQSGFLDKPQRSRTTNLQQVTEPAVLAAEIEQLPDLAGYLKFASTPEWRRVRISARS
jgi:type IV secretory pathway TraG/TraD family ATPase VirD4